MGRGLKQAFRRDPCRSGSIADEIKQYLIGRSGLPSAFQDGTVSAFDAQAADLHQRVRPCLEDDPDHADGYGYTFQDQAFIKFPFQGDLPGGIRDRQKTVNAGQTVTELVIIKLQPLLYRIGNAVSVGTRKVLAVCGKDLFTV